MNEVNFNETCFTDRDKKANNANGVYIRISRKLHIINKNQYYDYHNNLYFNKSVPNKRYMKFIFRDRVSVS